MTVLAQESADLRGQAVKSQQVGVTGLVPAPGNTGCRVKGLCLKAKAESSSKQAHKIQHASLSCLWIQELQKRKD